MMPGHFQASQNSQDEMTVEQRRPSPARGPNTPRASPRLANTPSSDPDLTTARSLRFRPQPKEAQSAPMIDIGESPTPLAHGACSNSSSPTPIPKRLRNDRRRVSDPSSNRPKPQAKPSPFAVNLEPTDNNPSLEPSEATPQATRADRQGPDTSPDSGSIPARGLNDDPGESSGRSLDTSSSDDPADCDQSESSPSPQKCKPTGKEVHERVCELLKSGLTPGDKKGSIYVLSNPNYPDLVKVGLSTVPVKARLEQHERDCKYIPKKLYATDNQVEYCKRLEALIKADLEHHCHRWTCNEHTKKGEKITKTHEEFFQVTKDIAVDTLERWKDFMEKEEPYGWNRQLRPIWKHLLQARRPEFVAHVTISHEARQEHWDFMLAPPETSDYIDMYRQRAYDLAKSMYLLSQSTREYLHTFFWQMVTVVYALLNFAAYRNSTSFGAFALVLVCTGWKVNEYVNLGVKKRSRRNS